MCYLRVGPLIPTKKLSLTCLSFTYMWGQTRKRKKEREKSLSLSLPLPHDHSLSILANPISDPAPLPSPNAAHAADSRPTDPHRPRSLSRLLALSRKHARERPVAIVNQARGQGQPQSLPPRQEALHRRPRTHNQRIRL